MFHLDFYWGGGGGGGRVASTFGIIVEYFLQNVDYGSRASVKTGV